MIDWTGVFIAIGGLLFTILATIIGVLWSETKNNRSAIERVRDRLSNEYHNSDQVRRTIEDLVNPVKESLMRIEASLQSLQGSNFHNRNLG